MVDRGGSAANFYPPAVPDPNRFLKLSQSAATPEQAAMFMQQHFRSVVRTQLESCRLCPLGGVIKPIGFEGKTPSFVSLVTAGPIRYRNFVSEKCLPILGYRAEDVCFIPMQACEQDDRLTNYIPNCRGNFETQLALASSRVFVLMGTKPASYIYGTEPDSVKDIRGTWTQLKNKAGMTCFYFITDEPNATNQPAIEEDFRSLGSLLHYAWAVQMVELYPESNFQHQMSYDQIVDVVVNDFRKVLMNVQPAKRGEEFMRIMTRVVRDQSGLAVKAFWDNNLATKCGIDTTGPEWWANRFFEQQQQ